MTRLGWTLMLVLLVPACGDEADNFNTGPDMPTGELSPGAPDMRFVGPTGMVCHTDADCPNKNPTSAEDQTFALFVCAYDISQGCAATSGRCRPMQGPPYCGALKELCGCDGKTQVGDGDCKYESGFASGPTTGASHVGACNADGGI